MNHVKLFLLFCLQSLASEKTAITGKSLELFPSPKKGNNIVFIYLFIKLFYPFLETITLESLDL